MDDEAKWKRRFHVFAMVRLFGLATFLLGIAVYFTDILRDGGWPTIGLILIVVGLVDAVVAPKLLKMHWDREDAGQ